MGAAGGVSFGLGLWILPTALNIVTWWIILAEIGILGLAYAFLHAAVVGQSPSVLHVVLEMIEGVLG